LSAKGPSVARGVEHSTYTVEPVPLATNRKVVVSRPVSRQSKESDCQRPPSPKPAESALITSTRKRTGRELPFVTVSRVMAGLCCCPPVITGRVSAAARSASSRFCAPAAAGARPVAANTARSATSFHMILLHGDVRAGRASLKQHSADSGH
jgi:hypothetical protein